MTKYRVHKKLLIKIGSKKKEVPMCAITTNKNESKIAYKFAEKDKDITCARCRIKIWEKNGRIN